MVAISGEKINKMFDLFIDTIKIKNNVFDFYFGFIFLQIYTGRLDLNRTLTENGILKDELEFEHPPSIWLYYSDDFTIA